MVISTFFIWIIGAIIAAIASFVITKFSKKLDDAKVGVGCFCFLILTVVFSLILSLVLPSVTVITKTGSEYSEETSKAIFTFNNHSVSFCEDYIDNQTADILIIYPAYYGDENTIVESSDDIQLIEPATFVKCTHTPDHYFYEPSKIYSKKKKKAECQWILESASKIAEKEEAERQHKQDIYNKYLR